MINILDELFIQIGKLAITSYNRITQFEKTNKIDQYINSYRKKEKDEQILKQIISADTKEKTIEKIRTMTLEKMNGKTILILALAIIVTAMIFGMEMGTILFIIIILSLATIIRYPQLKRKRQYNDLNLELPYALRHMGTELKSGKGLYDTLTTISNSNYGSLSKEYKRVLEEIKYGTSNEKALQNMVERVNSEGLKRTTQQIITTLKIGGNLASSLNIIAEDITFDMQIKLKEYSQKLNGFILIYTFIAILGPVILLIMLMAASTVMGDIVPGSLILVLYGFFFPLIVVFLGVLIQKLEPKI
ncbi:type II secretion system F family protein [uncultured Methanobrevibacter sp.]|uniref:type II secretion system F family protein n=1 Tax=uncultured Methanobrevibacter sp. TaxID=253161 RepID=UPI0026DFDA3E|nr:type II secretion system F family protein [uncultured Methanobrevibacter sp.]